MYVPKVDSPGMEPSELMGALLRSLGVRMGWGERTFKGLIAVAFTLALIVFALIWFGAAMLCGVIQP